MPGKRLLSPQFHEYQKRFGEQGFEGVRKLPPIHRTYPSNHISGSRNTSWNSSLNTRKKNAAPIKQPY